MRSHIFQKFLIMISVVTLAPAIRPQGYKIDGHIDKKIPKYEYGYIVSDREGNTQGHVESRDGIFALGRYYVSLHNGTGQKVTYFADDFGYHPLVSYASTSPRGSSRTQFAMGEKAIAALSDVFPVRTSVTEANIITTTPKSDPSFSADNRLTSAKYTASEQSDLYLSASTTTAPKAENFYTQIGNIIPPFGAKIQKLLKSSKEFQPPENKAEKHAEKEVTNSEYRESEYQIVPHVPDLKQNYRLLENGLEEESVKNNSQIESAYYNNDAAKGIAFGSGLIKNGNEEQTDDPSSYAQFASELATDTNQTVTEDRLHLNVPSVTQLFFANTMKPIIVPEKLELESQKLTFSEEFPQNSIVASINSQNGYNEVNQTSLPTLYHSLIPVLLADPARSKDSYSASQSINSVIVNQSDVAVNEETERRPNVNPLAALQAGISIFSAENAKPNEELIEGNNIKYKTVVDIQEGISLNVTQNPDGSFALASNYGQRIPSHKVPQYRGLAYEKRLINPEAGNIVREVDPVIKQQKQEDFLRRQEAEILAVQKSIEELQQQIIDQIDAEHEEEQKKQEKVNEEKENYLRTLPKVDSLIQDQKSIQSNYSPIQVLPSEQRDEFLSVTGNPQSATVSHIPSQVQPFQDQIIADSIASAEHDQRTEPVHDIQNSVGAQSEGNIPIEDGEAADNVDTPTHFTVKSQNLAGLLMLHSRANVQAQELPTVQNAVALQDSPNVHLDYPHYDKEIVDLVPPSPIPVQDSTEPVLLEPHRVEHESKLLPVSPSPTLFPVKIDHPAITEKPIAVKQTVEYAKVVEVEKPVPVLQPYPVEITKFVHVDRPVPIPTPFAVSHPVPVPVAVPHPVEVPVPHLIPVPEIFPIALKEYYPVFIHKKDKDSGSKSAAKHQSIPKSVHSFPPLPPSSADFHILGSSLGGNSNSHSHIPDEAKKKPHSQAVTVIVKQNPELAQFLHSDGDGNQQSIDWSAFMAQHGGELQFGDESLRDAFEHVYKTGIPIALQEHDAFLRPSRKGRNRKKNALRNLRIEYGFKPPLRPSVQITEEVKPSIFGPSVRPDK